MSSRLNSKDKQRKINKIYNIAITVVIVLILGVGIKIFFGSSDSTEKASTTKEKETTSESVSNQKDTTKDAEDTEATDDEENLDDDEDTEDTKEPELTEVEETDENVAKAYTSEDWKAVDTTQSGEHTTSFEKGSADWNEMTEALSVGTGISSSNMTIWFLGNGGSPSTAVGTVSAKNDSKSYRVNLEWVDGSGWKPVKVQELVTNDKK